MVAIIQRFIESYRAIFAYTGATVLLIGALVQLIRKFPGTASASHITAPPGISGHQGKRQLIYIAAALAIIFLFWAPYAFQGQDCHVKIFDNLDCHVPQTKVLAASGKAFSLNPGTRLDNFINGLPLSGVDSGYNVITWLFMIFPPFIAYALNDLMVRLIAFLGMVLLLRTYFIKTGDQHREEIITGAALCFALLPFYPAGGISIAGIPLLLYCFLNIRNRKTRYTDFLVIFLFPFYSKLALAGFFIAVALFILFIIDWVQKKKINIPYLAGLALLTVTYCFTHFHLLYSFLDPNFTSFREEIRALGLTTTGAIKETWKSFIFDKVNEVGAHHLFVIGAAALAMVVGIIKKWNLRLMATLVVIAFITSAMWGFKYWNGIIALKEKYQVLTAFDSSRFYWLNPFLWYLIFALALLVISKIKFGKILIALFILGQIGFMFTNYNWEYRNRLGIKSSFAGSPLTYSLTYKEFYSEALFKEIEAYINKPQTDYRVVSLGIHPGISQYNGFYTLDIYTDIYPLEYKHKFRKIIERELAKSKELEQGFDTNAKRCFLMVAELHGIKSLRGLAFSRGITKTDRHIKINHLDLNTGALKDLGGEYIFSAVEILNYRENGLQLEKAFTRKESPWKIYLYKVL